MKNNLTDLEWIDRYFDRNLSAEEKAWLEKRLSSEPDLKQLHDEHYQLIQGIRYAHLENKLNQLRTLEKSFAQKEKKNPVLNIYWKPLAAAATLAIAISTYLLLQNPSPEQLFEENFQVYPNVFEPAVRGAEDHRSAAFRAYDQQDYSHAIPLLEALLVQRQEPGVLLLLGNAYLAIGNTAKAQENLISLIKNFDELDEQAKWYLGLSYLKEGKKEQAQLVLQELDPEVTYSKKAKEVLKQID